MQERERPGQGDVRGPSRGDTSAELSTGFTDWDNPEDEVLDEVEDAPEGYYEEEQPDEGYVPGPDDPDYDLSEAAGYSGWERPRRRSLLPQWLVVAVSLLLILALLVPALLSFR